MACPGKWKHGLKPAAPCFVFFDPYPPGFRPLGRMPGRRGEEAQGPERHHRLHQLRVHLRGFISAGGGGAGASSARLFGSGGTRASQDIGCSLVDTLWIFWGDIIGRMTANAKPTR